MKEQLLFGRGAAATSLFFQGKSIVFLFMMIGFPLFLPAQSLRFDFGTGTSPVASGYTEVTPFTLYSDSLGYGFATLAGLDSRDRGGPTDLERDFVLGDAWEFNADILNGIYQVTFISGDEIASQSRFDFMVEGVASSVAAGSGSFSYVNVIVEVTDGQLNISVVTGGTNAKRIVGIEVSPPPTERLRFDFGPGPVADGYAGPSHSSLYSAVTGYGFATTDGLISRDRGGADSVNRDFVAGAAWEFMVDVTNGAYKVTLTSGDEIASQSRFDFFVEGAGSSIAAGSGAFSSESLVVEVSDGQLNIVAPAGGTSTKRINGLIIEPTIISSFPGLGGIVGSMYVMDNGVVRVEIDQRGEVRSIRRWINDVPGDNMVTAVNVDITEGGYRNLTSIPPSAVEILQDTDSVFEVMFRIDLSNDPHGLTYDIHYLIRAEESGYFHFINVSNQSGADQTLGEFRTVVRKVDRFNYAVASEREGVYPTEPGFEFIDETYDIPQKRNDPSYEYQVGDIYGKYEWVAYMKEASLQGWVSESSNEGIWIVAASDEYIGSPMVQDITVHDNVLHRYWRSGHYGVEGTAVPPGWEKMYGPIFIYINDGQENAAIIDEALQTRDLHLGLWPYDWINHENFSVNRATVRGDVSIGGLQENLQVVLTEFSGDSYQHSGGYVYHAVTGAGGSFEIPDVRYGDYYMHVWALEGAITGEFEQPVAVDAPEVTVNASFMPAQYDFEIFRVGQADRFSMGRFSEPGLPREFEYRAELIDEPELEKGKDVNFIAGQSDPATDWYYAQLRGSFWNIHFTSANQYAGEAILRIPIAGADGNPTLVTILNGDTARADTIRGIGSDSGYRRVALRSARYGYVEARFDAGRLNKGANVLTLHIPGRGPNHVLDGTRDENGEPTGRNGFVAIMYDAVFLDVNGCIAPEPDHDKKLLAYEGMAYVDRNLDDGLAGGEGWSAPWEVEQSDAAITFEAGLTYGPLKTFCNSLEVTGLSDTASVNMLRRLAKGVDKGPLWISMLVRVNENDGGTFFIRPGDVDGLQFGVGQNGEFAVNHGKGKKLTAGDAYLIVALISMNRGKAPDKIYLWAGPELGQGNPSGKFIISTGQARVGTIDKIVFAAEGEGSYQVDEVRLGTTFRSVVPGVIPSISDLLDLLGGGQAHLQVYPNQATDAVFVDFELVGAVGAARISIYNFFGKKVHDQTLQLADGSASAEIDVTGLKKGIYLVHVKAGGKNYTSRLVVGD